jgi:type II secretory pathway pseudopilin PulG
MARFTLIEMLVVLSIIIVLAGMVMVGASAARNKANKVRTQARITALQTALVSYRSTYQYWPFHVRDAADDVLIAAPGTAPSGVTINNSMADLLATLYGSNAASNPRKVHFLEQGESDTDAWGESFRVVLDMDANGLCRTAKTFVSASDVSKEVVIWSKGKDRRDSRTASDSVNRDNIRSW